MLSIYLAMLEDDDDKHRFKTLYDNYKNFMIKYAYSNLHDNDYVVNAVDDALLSIAKNIKNIPYDTEKAYIYMIIKNTTINEAKRVKKNMNVDFYSDDYNFVDFNTPADNLIYQESLKKLIDLLKSMPREYRDTITLRYLYGMSLKDISLILNININTVKSIVRRGKAMIKEKLV